MSIGLDLSQRLTAPLDLKENRLTISGEETMIEGSRMSLSEMKGVLYNKQLETNTFAVAYYVFRRVAINQDLHIFNKSGLRYDITVLPPGDWGGECPRTFGHVHRRTPTSPPEAFEVVEGKPHFLIQNVAKAGSIEVVEAERGDRIVVSQDTLHLIINPSDQLVVTSNLVSNAAIQDYEYVRRMRGAAYFELQGRRFVQNRCYHDQFEIEFVRANLRQSQGTIFMKSQDKMYDLFTAKPETFDFLRGASPDITTRIN